MSKSGKDLVFDVERSMLDVQIFYSRTASYGLNALNPAICSPKAPS